MTRTGRSGRSLPAMLVAVLVALLAFIWPPVAAAQSVATDCSAEQAALASVHSQIDAHNAKPHRFELPRQAAALAAYDAEAAQLNAAQTTAIQNLQACRQRVQAMEQERQRALDDLLDRANSDYTPGPVDPAKVRAVRDAWNGLTGAGRRPSPSTGPNPATRQWEVPPGSPLKPLYDAVRATTPEWPFPNVRLQGAARPRIGDPDPSGYGGGVIGRAPGPRGGPNVSPDHIVPIARMMYLRGYTRLSPENMIAVANSPVNLQWMSRLANSAKSSKSIADVPKADPVWARSQVALEKQTLTRLQDIIDRLLANGG
ncbi:hypothetical protein GCM10027445_27070 [Amycolatopsis endophytica]|uniref:HNH endonuclease n=1 Tax=Amycolatopsis endophytica TaxID=860233 RepID=A0A853B4Y6_9PSEU|nr:hypothetical protein [Amycolatopsis endophytica]NYI90283.1 hypothetical protein [Amycolatopsis endophytica]